MSIYLDNHSENLALESLSKKSFFFSSSYRSIHGENLIPILTEHRPTSSNISETAILAIGSYSSKQKGAMLLGAIPFNFQSPSALYVSNSVRETTVISNNNNMQGNQLIKTGYVSSVPSRNQYMKNVAKALKQLEISDLRKIVLDRAIDVQLESKIDIRDLIYSLKNKNKEGYTFHVPVKHGELFYSFLGMSPELLVRKKGTNITTSPLAGSIKRGANFDEDRKNSERLLLSSKDQHEHSFVVTEIKRILEPYCSSLIVPESPTLKKTPTLWHLCTNISGKLLNPSLPVLDLALALHPTPAICGYPTDMASKKIDEIEGIDRKLYAGLVGWMNADGDGEWAISLRCAEFAENSIRFMAGAGIVPGSQPECELEETTVKLTTMLNALQLNAVLDEGF